MPIVHSNFQDSENYDSLVIVANDLDKDVSKLGQLSDHFINLKSIKEVMIISLINHNTLASSLIFNLSTIKTLKKILPLQFPTKRDWYKLFLKEFLYNLL